MDQIEAACPIYYAVSSERCWKCKQTQEVIGLVVRDFICDGEKLVEAGEACFLTDIEQMPEDVFVFLHSRNNRYMKRYSRTADITYFANSCSCGANFGDFYLYSEPDGAFFPSTEDDCKRVIFEKLPFTGTLRFVASHASLPAGVRIPG